MTVIRLQESWVDPDPYSGVLAQDTYSCAHHFFDMSESDPLSGTIVDVIRGATVTVNASSTSGLQYRRLIAIAPTGVASGFVNLKGDFAVVVAGRYIANPDDPNDCGHLEWLMKNTTENWDLRAHPYQCTLDNGWRTIPYPPRWVRTEGEISAHALVRRGDVIEHYSLPRGFIDSTELSNVPSSNRPVLSAPDVVNLGHGGYGTPAYNGAGRDITAAAPWSNSGNVAQDYAGVAILNYAPSMEKMVAGLRWIKDEWTTKTSGKRLYPGWCNNIIKTQTEYWLYGNGSIVVYGSGEGVAL